MKQLKIANWKMIRTWAFSDSWLVKKTSNNVNIIDLIDLKAEESKSQIKTLILLILFFKLFSARDFDLSKSEKMIRNVSIIFIVINSV